MDCLIGLILVPEDEETRKGGLLVAHSLECNISVDGNTKEEAAKKLAGLLEAHIKDCLDGGRMPYVHNEETFEKFGRYCAEKRFPDKLPDIDMGYGMKLRCYDLTDS